MGCRDKDVEFVVVFNECFILMESIRAVLKQPKETVQYLGEPLREIESDLLLNATTLIVLLQRFTNKWATAYTSWLSSFKSHAKNRHLFIEGTPEAYLTYQCNYPYLEALMKDYKELQVQMKAISSNLSNRKWAFNDGDWINFFVRYSVSGVWFSILNFIKIRKLTKGK